MRNRFYLKGVLTFSKVMDFFLDMKPSNMLVNTNGEVKICDFGVSIQVIFFTFSTLLAYHLLSSPSTTNGTPSCDVSLHKFRSLAVVVSVFIAYFCIFLLLSFILWIAFSPAASQLNCKDLCWYQCIHGGMS